MDRFIAAANAAARLTAARIARVQGVESDGEDSGTRCPTADKLLLSCGSHRLALYDPLTDSTIPVHREAHLRPDRTARLYLKY
jgi:hypothetical protein